MKLKPMLNLLTILTLLWMDMQGVSLVFAETPSQTSPTITASENTNIKAEYHTHLDKEEMVLHFQPDSQLSTEKISAHLNQSGHQKTLNLTEVASGLYELRLPVDQVSPQDTLDILLETKLKEAFQFKNLSLDSQDQGSFSSEQVDGEISNQTSTIEDLTSTVQNTLENTTTSAETTSPASTSNEEASSTRAETSTETPQSPANKKEENTSLQASLSSQSLGQNGDFDITIANVPKSGIQSVQVPVWSEDKGQDDIRWYRAEKQADGTYKVSVKVSQHNFSTGKYNIHLYYQQSDGKTIGILATSTNVIIPKPSGELRIERKENSQNDYFDVIISNVSSPAGVKTVKVPIWSEENGQDDIKWYRADKQADGNYQLRVFVKDHKSYFGNYHVHLYYEQENGQTVGVSSTKTNIDFPKPSGKLTIQKQSSQLGSFEVVLSDVSAALAIDQVYLPIWTEENGQDDIKWYKADKQADGTYKTTVQISQHKNSYGPYKIHSYYRLSNGQMFGVTDTTVILNQQKAIINSKSTENNQQIFTISNIDSKVEKLQLAVWTSSKGQDDLTWYDALRQENGSYQVVVPLKNHNFEKGQYNAHLYGGTQNQPNYLGQSGFAIETISALEPTTVNVLSVSPQQGILNVAVNEPLNSKKIKEIRIAAWSESNQSNLSWYVTTPTDSLTNTTINVSRHYFQTGNYTVHAYITYLDGSVTGFNLGSYYLQGPIGNLPKVLRLASDMIGVVGGSPEHRKLVDDYNSITPRPVGYLASYSDDWCDLFITTIFQRAGLSVLIGREVGVERHIQIFKTLGIWIEDGNITPKQGDIITFNWDSIVQPNDGFADHIGIVEYVDAGYIYTIEGNGNNQVVRRKYRVGHGNIRGFARPRY